jgi:hypothetical protein
MTAGTAPVRARPSSGFSSAIGLALVVLAVVASSGPYLLRARAAVVCDVAERVGGSLVTMSGGVLLVVNLAVAAGLWALLRSEGGLGLAAALVVGVTVFAIIAAVYLWLTAVPAGYPTPSCPGGCPAWWPVLLPG